MSHIQSVESTPNKSDNTANIVDDGPWKLMYRRDRYARDRVMKSARMLLPFLSTDDKKPDTILDVGCFTHEARKYFPKASRYIGIDGKAFHKETKVIDLNHGFEPIPCNLALCLETLEHLVDPEDCVVSIKSSLPENGHLVVSLPNEATIFHRLRCLLGRVDAECFSGEGKHLHLPSLEQSRQFLARHFEIEREQYYISPSGVGSREAWVGGILGLIPDSIHYTLANWKPALFARGFIFLLRKPQQASN